MDYVAVQFPMVRYDSTGLPVTVQNQEGATALPATFTGLPTTASALVAFSPALIAQVVTMPLPTLPPRLTQAIALNMPAPTKRNKRGDN